MDYPAQRRQQLAQCLADEGLDALLLSSPVNVTYLTGFSGESSYLVLTRQRPVLVSDFRFTEQTPNRSPPSAPASKRLSARRRRRCTRPSPRSSAGSAAGASASRAAT
jgi:Xaa-Pro aminopeptidase